MQNFTLTCQDGYSKQVMAASQEEAVDMFMQDAEVQQHVQTSHPEMAGKSPEEMKATVMSMVAPMAAEQPAMPEEPKEEGVM